jgi:glucuronosyltransferase
VAVFVVLTSLTGCNGARVLGLFPLSSPSHAAVNHALVKELARRGHQVTVVSPFPQKIPIANYTDIATEKLEIEALLNKSGE